MGSDGMMRWCALTAGDLCLDLTTDRSAMKKTIPDDMFTQDAQRHVLVLIWQPLIKAQGRREGGRKADGEAGRIRERERESHSSPGLTVNNREERHRTSRLLIEFMGCILMAPVSDIWRALMWVHVKAAELLQVLNQDRAAAHSFLKHLDVI